ncbi:MAG: tagatose-bisphosphate aldolase [Pseudomonadota bacterium]|nr:tagatose-bisphosphate aldolase [Pseudomonadota bacterium]
MRELNTTERRALARISTAAGGMLIVAADQRNSMKAVMNAPDGADSITVEGLRAAKADLVTHLANHGPAILLDPEVAVPQVIDDDVLDRDTALVVGMDASGYETVDGLRFTRLVDGVTARKIREVGGDAAKMLYYLRTDQQSLDSRVGDEIRKLIQECEAEGVLVIIEILVYQLPDESDEDYARIFPRLVEEAAKFSVDCGAKVLKLQYPGSEEACKAVTEAAGGAPWAVLSAGVDHETFIEQVRIAVSNGASGAMAGRSLWKDSLSVDPADRESLLATRARPRLAELSAVIDEALGQR